MNAVVNSSVSSHLKRSFFTENVSLRRCHCRRRRELAITRSIHLFVDDAGMCFHSLFKASSVLLQHWVCLLVFRWKSAKNAFFAASCQLASSCVLWKLNLIFGISDDWTIRCGWKRPANVIKFWFFDVCSGRCGGAHGINIFNIYGAFFSSSDRSFVSGPKYQICFSKSAIWMALSKSDREGYFAFFAQRPKDTTGIVKGQQGDDSSKTSVILRLQKASVPSLSKMVEVI